MSCVICGHERVFVSYRFDAYQVCCCRRCGHGVLVPMPRPAELEKLYSPAYFASHYELIRPESVQEFSRRISQEKHRVKSVRQYAAGGRLLDVGCGPGYFLYACNNRFEVTGFDPSQANRDFFHTHLEVELVHDFSRLAGRRFEVITFWHSLEHCPDPRAELTRFISLLAPGGVLIVDVPNHHSIDACMEAYDWPGWDVPFHCHHFTHRSLNLLVQELGLEVVGCKTYHCGFVRDRLAGFPLLKPFARPLAKLFPGSAVMLALRLETS